MNESVGQFVWPDQFVSSVTKLTLLVQFTEYVGLLRWLNDFSSFFSQQSHSALFDKLVGHIALPAQLAGSVSQLDLLACFAGLFCLRGGLAWIARLARLFCKLWWLVNIFSVCRLG